jgi:hypothetical protein
LKSLYPAESTGATRPRMIDGTVALTPPYPLIGQDGGLAPAPFHQNPTTVALDPPVGYPPLVWPWWNFPTAWYPSVGGAVPVMIAANPNMVWAGGRWPCFDNSRGRPDLDDHFGAQRSGAQEQPEGGTDQ